MNTIISEAGITLDTGFFSNNIIVFALEVSNDVGKAASLGEHGLCRQETSFGSPGFIVYLIAKAWCIDNGQ